MSTETAHLTVEDILDIEQALAPDLQLARLVDVVNQQAPGTVAVDLTLIMSGQTVGGTLIPARQWRQELRDELARTLPGDVGTGVGEATSSSRPAAVSITSFLHLKDACVPAHDGVLPIGNTRARLNEVSAWSLRSLGR